MAASWSTKRRLVQGGIFFIIVAIFAGFAFWQLFYKAPTCFDGKKNGDETGVDCGGSCKILCTSDTLNPIVLWSKVFNISGDVYSAVAYIENPNTNSLNRKAKYQFSIYGENGVIITTKEGETSIPKGKKFAVFESGFILKNGKPKTSDFKFLSFGPWEKDFNKDPDVSIKHSAINSTTTVPRITGTITNNSLDSIHSIELAVFVLDGNENVVAASNTFIDDLVKKSTQDFVFTWPKPFNLGVETCVSPLDIVVALDRSGSMKSESKNPPEPFNTVKSTAQSFVKNLSTLDRVSIISFGDDSRTESSLDGNKNIAISSIDNLFMSSTTAENTNIYSALVFAEKQLGGDKSRQDSKKILILLTDGVPNLPVSSTTKDFALIEAGGLANKLKSEGISIFTIGLGKDINEDFLKNLSSTDTSYFLAPNKETLGSVYRKIAQNICPKKPNVINVIYREIK